MTELKPCPFCGLPIAKYLYHEWGYGAECGNPKCVMYEQESIKVEIWNTRPLEDALRAEFETARARIAELEEANRWIPVKERLPEKELDSKHFSVEVEILIPNPNYTNRYLASGYYEFTNMRWWAFSGGNQLAARPSHWRYFQPPEVSNV